MPLYVNYPTKCLANPVTFHVDFKFPITTNQALGALIEINFQSETETAVIGHAFSKRISLLLFTLPCLLRAQEIKYIDLTAVRRSTLNETLRNHHESSLHRGPDDFVFCKKDGSALDPDVLRKDALYPILDRLGIPRKKGASGFHTFRHSAASIVNEQTGNLKLAQKFLGHSTIKMTADIYTHTSAEAERGAAIALERAIYGDLFPVVPNIENRNNFVALN